MEENRRQLESQLESRGDYNQINIRTVATLQLSSGMTTKVRNAVIEVFFRNVKFLSNQDTTKELTEKVIDYVHTEDERNNMTQEYKDSFALTYIHLVDVTISRRRSYVQQQMSKVLLNLMNSTHTGSGPETDLCPSYELFLKCALRDIDVDNEEEMVAFCWYWEHILSTNGGFSLWHKDDIKYNLLPSECTYKFEDYDKEFKLFPPATEAFFVLLYENCIDKWKHHALWKHDNPKERLPIMNKQNKDEPLHKTKYTITDIGQQKYGGWSKAGLEKFTALRKQVKASRLEKVQVEGVDVKTGKKTTKTLAQHILVEQRALERLRKIYKKDEPAKEDKKRKRPIEETHVVTLELDD